MTGFNHTLAGAIIGIVVPAPFVPIVAYFSHFILDVFPHFGRHPDVTHGSKRLRQIIVIDGILSLAVFLLAASLFPDKWFMIGVGSFFAVLPDFQWIFKRYLHTPKWFLNFSSKIQWGERPWGWTLEILYGSIFMGMLFQVA